MGGVEPCVADDADVNKTLAYLQDIEMIGPADVIGAQTLCALAGVESPRVRLAVVLALWSARTGDVLVDLAHLPTSQVDREGEVQPLPHHLWPTDRAAWAAEVMAAAPLAGPAMAQDCTIGGAVQPDSLATPTRSSAGNTGLEPGQVSAESPGVAAVQPGTLGAGAGQGAQDPGVALGAGAQPGNRHQPGATLQPSPMAAPEPSPIVVDGTRVYLQRLWAAEAEVVANLALRLGVGSPTSRVLLDDPLAWKPGLVQREGFDLQGTLATLLAPVPGGEGQGVDRDQLAAVKSIVSRPFTVVSGGPGTGKTATVAKALALVLTGYTGSGADTGQGQMPVIKVAAFTGKAAARAKEALAKAADEIDTHHAGLGLNTEGIRALEPTTIARLLGMGWGISTAPKVHAENPIEADMIVIDEVSMVSLGDLRALLAGTHPRTHVVLVGDHNQLPSIDAGQVMADLIAGATLGAAPMRNRQTNTDPLNLSGSCEQGSTAGADSTGAGGAGGASGGQSGMGESDSEQFSAGQLSADGLRADHSGPNAPSAADKPMAGGSDLGWPRVNATSGVGDSLITLRTNYRSEQHINRLANAVLAGDGTATWDQLEPLTPQSTSAFFKDLAQPGARGRCAFVNADLRGPLTKERVGAGLAAFMIHQRRAVRDLVLAGDVTGALAANTDAVVLAVHQRGWGSRQHWNQAMDRWFHEVPLHRVRDDWVGRPVMVTANDRHIDVVNGDVGVVVSTGDGAQVALDGRMDSAGQPDLIDLHRLRTLETVHAMTVHKSQGSEYGTVVVLLPAVVSPLMTRELLYTAITRAKKNLVIVGSPAVLEAGITTTNARASTLGLRLAEAIRGEGF